MPLNVANHTQVFEIVKRRKIHLAEDLYKLAEEQAALGDGSLLHYCSGQAGMKRNLQKIIDCIWTPDGGVRVEVNEARTKDTAVMQHAAPLAAERLDKLRRLACKGMSQNQSQKQASSETLTCPKNKILQRLETVGKPSTSSAGEVLFDQYNQRAEVVFRPRRGLWRLRDFYELLVACRQEEALAGVHPSSCIEGGLTIPRTEAGWHTMLRARVAQPRIPFADLGDADRAAAAAEIRFGIACGQMQWQGPSRAGEDGSCRKPRPDDWIEGMAQDPSFEVDTLSDLPFEERLVRMWSFRHVECRHWQGLLRAVQKCQHSLKQTTGFRIEGDQQIIVTGSRKRVVSHNCGTAAPWGMRSAEAAVEEAAFIESGKQLPFQCLGADRSGIHCPQTFGQTSRLDSLRLALTNESAEELKSSAKRRRRSIRGGQGLLTKL